MKKNRSIGFISKIPIIRIMKIYTVLLCLTMVKIFALDANAQSISLNVQNEELRNVITEIESKSNFSFFYNNNLIDVSKKISIKASNENIKNVLKVIFSGTEIDFRVVKKHIVLFPKNEKSAYLKLKTFLNEEQRSKTAIIETPSAREIEEAVASVIQDNVTGTVIDEVGIPLPGVSVLIKGTTIGTQTDFDGNYSIKAQTGETLVFSYVGQKTEERVVGTSKIIDIQMVIDAQDLDEVIVVAYGTAKKGDYTGAATQINAETIENRSISNISSVIEGASAGVTVNSGSGQPGSGQSIRIRGFGSVSASSAPLYVVDGAPFYGSVNSINPNDIESVTILKDAASTSLYGNKAANGVVMITTKRGKNKKGQLSLNVSSSIISRSIPEYDRLGPDTYYELMWESMRNGRAIPGVDDVADVNDANVYASDNIIGELGNNPYNVADDNIVGQDGKINPNARLLYPDDLDWTDAIMRLGFRQNYNLSYRGGMEKVDYYVSMGYLDEDGYINKSDYNRFTGRANVNFQATRWLKSGLNIAASTSKGNQAQATSAQSSSFVNPIRFTRNMGPIYNIYQHDPVTGEYLLDENGNRMYYLNDNRPSGASGGRHIVAEIDYNTDLDEITSLNAKTFFDITFTEGLVLTVNANIDQRQWYTTEFENKLVGDGAPGGRASRTYNRRTTVGFNQLLNYSKSFGNHNIKLLAAHESVELKVNDFEGTKTEIIADGNDELVNFVTITDLDSETDLLRDESYFGRANYDYDGKYFLSASYRTDGTSKFSKNKRWGEFWSLGGAWRLDKEAFLDMDWINLLKVRASYGEVGNNVGIGFYAYQGLYELGYNNQSESGYYQDSLEAPNLFWETSASYDIALEFGLFDRLNGSIEYYDRESDNLLFDVPLPLSSGTEDIPMNIGTMFNKGIEISLDYDIVRNENFSWNLGVVAATINNEFTKLPQEEIIDGSKKLMVGHSIYDYWLKQWYGVDPADGSALYVPTQEALDNDSDIREVDGIFLTTNQANAEYHYAGTAIPDLTGAFTNSFRYKDFGFNFMFTYQLGGEILDYNYRSLMSSGDYGNALHRDILRRWQAPGDITDVPRMDASQTTNFDATSDRWLVDADYLNLKQVNFSYNLPMEVSEKLGISSAQLFLNAENLFAINKRKGMDIQQNFNGTTSNVYTPSRIITMGINVKF